MPRRPFVLLAMVATLVGVFAQPAFAHVTVQPGEAARGSYTKLAFRVPNEDDSAATVKLEVELPAEIEEARTKPVPGWTAHVADGRITWDGGRIEPGEFQEFEISVGPLPETDELEFKTIQTYDDGEVVRWIEPTPAGGDEPDHPAPVLRLVASSGDDHHADDAPDAAAPADDGDGDSDDDSDGDDSDDSGTSALPIVGIALGAAALVVALVSRRRRG